MFTPGCLWTHSLSTRLFEPDTRPTAILWNELDASTFKRLTNDAQGCFPGNRLIRLKLPDGHNPDFRLGG
jgi:hypothetical protein